jgi:hypothetical protein
MPERLNLQLDTHQPPVTTNGPGDGHFVPDFDSPILCDGGVFLCLEV